MKENLFNSIINIFFLFRLIHLIKSESIPTEIHIEKLETLTYSSLTKFHLYVDLSNYKDKEESILTLNNLRMTEVKKFNAKYVSNTPLNKIMDHMPIDYTEFKLDDSIYEEYKFLYFQKKDSSTADSYLLVYMELESKSGLEATATIVLCDHERIQYVTEKTVYARTELKPYVPKILKYLVVKDVDFGDSYFFYFPFEGYQTVFEGELLDNNTNAINTHKTMNSLITFTFPSNQTIHYNINITIVLFGSKITATLEIRNTFSSVLSFYERKEEQMIYMEVVNSFNPFYILGSYKEEKDSMIYFEKLFGDLNLYYKDYINGATIQSVLPSYLDKTNSFSYIKASKKNDLIMGECISPCGFNIYFISDPLPSEINFGEKIIVYLTPNKEVTITGPNSNEAMNIEIQNIEKVKDLEVTIFGTNVPSFEYIHRKEYKSTQPKIITLRSKVETIVGITLGTQRKYNPLTNTDAKASLFSIYSFENDPTISSIIIDLTNSASEDVTMNYYLGYGVYPFIQDPIKLGSILGEFEFTLSNPYLQEPPFPQDPEAKYYLIMSFDKAANIAFEVTLTKFSFLNTLEEKKVNKIDNLETFTLKPVEKDRSLIFFITKCSQEESILKFKYGSKTINGQYITKQNTVDRYDNPFNNLMIQFDKSGLEKKFPGVLFYYAYPTLAEVLYIQFNDEFDIHYFDPNDNSTEVELQFTSPLLKNQNYAVIYKVYIYNKANPNPKYDVCKAVDGYDSTIVYKSNELKLKLTIALDRTKENHVFITAMPSEGISPLFYYNTIHFKTIQPAQIPEGFSYVWWIVIGLIFIIIIISIIFIYAYKRKRANKQIDPLTISNEPLVD